MHLSQQPPCRRRRIAFHLATKASTGKVVANSAGSSSTDPFGDDAMATSGSSGSLCPAETIVGRREWKGLPRPIGRGLCNLGNSCFVNATLQCLAYVPPLAQLLLLPGASGDAAWGNGGASVRGGHVINFVEIMRDTIARMHGVGPLSSSAASSSASSHAAGDHAVSPEAFVANLRALGRHFRNGRQEDAHEFLVHLLEALQQHCLRSAGLPIMASALTTEQKRLVETTAPHRLFGGKLRSRLRCLDCGKCLDRLEPFLDLSLPLVGGGTGERKKKKKKAKKAKEHAGCAFGRFGSSRSDAAQWSLEDAIEAFTSPERLGDSNHWRCPQCGKSALAEKQLSVVRAPNVCVIHLKRFAHRADRGITKVGDHVAFSEVLHLPVGEEVEEHAFEC